MNGYISLTQSVCLELGAISARNWPRARPKELHACINTALSVLAAALAHCVTFLAAETLAISRPSTGPVCSVLFCSAGRQADRPPADWIEQSARWTHPRQVRAGRAIMHVKYQRPAGRLESP